MKANPFYAKIPRKTRLLLSLPAIVLGVIVLNIAGAIPAIVLRLQPST